MIESTLSTEELFLTLYWGAHDLYPEVAPDWIRFRRGTDQMDMISELSFHRVVEKDYLHLFPGLISRFRYHRRRKDLTSTSLRESSGRCFAA